MARRWRPGVGAMATAPRRYDRRDAMLSPPPRRRRRRCEDTARRLRVRLGIVVRDEDGGVAHVVDGRVVQLVLGRVAQVRRQRVFDPLAELAGHNADQEDRLAALGVGLAVERIRTIRGVAGEVNAFAEEVCVPACEWMSPHSNEDAATYFPQNERLKPCCRIFGARSDEQP